jgi:hypothetical protein
MVFRKINFDVFFELLTFGVSIDWRDYYNKQK